MKKTYKTFNGENRNSFFRVGKALVEVRFTPTYTTDNGIMQKAIEDSYSFKVGEIQLATSSMTDEKFKDLMQAPFKYTSDKVFASFAVHRTLRLTLQYPEFAKRYFDNLPKAVQEYNEPKTSKNTEL